MASESKLLPGQVSWIDLTVPNADPLRDFYSDVTGWTPPRVSMGDYRDYCMNAGDGHNVAGICHARGTNVAMQRCEARGGKILGAPRSAGAGGRFCVIQDPAGATAALYESRSQSE